MEVHIGTDELSVTVSSQGGSFTSIQDSCGREYLWQPDVRVWTGQAPVLFPICGGLRDGKAVTQDGQNIELGRHGFAKDKSFELVAQAETTVSFVLKDDEQTRAQYPFPFEFTTSYEVKDKTIAVSYAVTNTGTNPLPFFVGGHPAFRCPLDAGESYKDYKIEFEADEGDVCTAVPSTGLINVEHRSPAPQQGRVLPLTHELFSFAETIYDQLSSHVVTYTKSGEHKGLRISFPEMPYLIIWAKPQGDFVAIEPWSGLSTCSDEDDIFEHKRGCLIAEPGETVTRGFTIDIL